MRDQQLRDVRAEVGHPVARLDPRRLQCPGETSGLAGELAIGRAAVTVDDRHPVGVHLGGALQETQRRQVAVRHGGHVGLLAAAPFARAFGSADARSDHTPTLRLRSVRARRGRMVRARACQSSWFDCSASASRIRGQRVRALFEAPVDRLREPGVRERPTELASQQRVGRVARTGHGIAPIVLSDHVEEPAPPRARVRSCRS